MAVSRMASNQQGSHALYGPQGRPRNFRAMGDDKLDKLYQHWHHLDYSVRSISGLDHASMMRGAEPALSLLYAEWELRFNGTPLPPDIVLLLAELAR